MTDAPPLNGGDPSEILAWLVAQVAELREENGRMKMLLALHGADPDAAVIALATYDVRITQAESEMVLRSKNTRNLINTISQRVDNLEQRMRLASILR